MAMALAMASSGWLAMAMPSFVSSSSPACPIPSCSLPSTSILLACHKIRPACFSTKLGWQSSPGDLLCCRASADDVSGVPREILEDSKFVPINDDDPQFGPPAMLLMGLAYDEVLKVQEVLKNMEGDFLKVLICTHEMIKGTLWDAMNSSQLDLKTVKIAEGVPRICFLSGLTGEEIMMFVQAFPEAMFAALVPNNAQKKVEEVVEEIMGDHERLTQQVDRQML